MRFQALDGWRGIAACMVALLHLPVYSHVAGVPFFVHSWLFVDFFFVLSGFVIAASYGERLVKGFGVERFMLLRLGRLYPVHISVLAVYVAYELVTSAVRHVTPFSEPAKSLSSLLANLTMTQAMHLFDSLTWNFPSWSISTEFFTYAIFALLLVALGRVTWIALVGIVLSAPLLLFVLTGGDLYTTTDYSLIRCLYGFCIGALAYGLFRRYGARWKAGSALELTAVVAMVLFVCLANGATTLGAPLIFGMVVLTFAREGGAVSQLLKSTPFAFLGAVSYSIYMVHAFIAYRFPTAGKLASDVFHTNLFSGAGLLGTSRWQGDVLSLVYLACVIGVAALSFKYIENPGREASRKLASKIRHEEPLGAAHA